MKRSIHENGKRRSEFSGRNGNGALSQSERFAAACSLLLQGYQYAAELERDVWEFAVDIGSLSKLGMTPNDFRWAVVKGYLQHAREATLPGQDGRTFVPTGNLTFCKRTCFVLTESGAEYARALCDRDRDLHMPKSGEEAVCEVAPEASSNGREKLQRLENGEPQWDPDRHELRVDDKLVKRFKWPAMNQETILAVFDEEGWPPRIDDPLPPTDEIDPKRRLHDTIKCLNRKQQNQLIHFHGDGTGEGVIWEVVEPSDAAGRHD